MWGIIPKEQPFLQLTPTLCRLAQNVVSASKGVKQPLGIYGSQKSERSNRV